VLCQLNLNVWMHDSIHHVRKNWITLMERFSVKCRIMECRRWTSSWRCVQLSLLRSLSHLSWFYSVEKIGIVQDFLISKKYITSIIVIACTLYSLFLIVNWFFLFQLRAVTWLRTRMEYMNQNVQQEGKKVACSHHAEADKFTVNLANVKSSAAVNETNYIGLTAAMFNSNMLPACVQEV